MYFTRMSYLLDCFVWFYSCTVRFVLYVRRQAKAWDPCFGLKLEHCCYCIYTYFPPEMAWWFRKSPKRQEQDQRILTSSPIHIWNSSIGEEKGKQLEIQEQLKASEPSYLSVWSPFLAFYLIILFLCVGLFGFEKFKQIVNWIPDAVGIYEKDALPFLSRSLFISKGERALPVIKTIFYITVSCTLQSNSKDIFTNKSGGKLLEVALFYYSTSEISHVSRQLVIAVSHKIELEWTRSASPKLRQKFN
jgi:hypothetical protein